MAQADVMSFLGVFDGGARPNRYRVTIANPPMGLNPSLDRSIEFLCRSASIPASTLGVCIASYMGREVKIAGDRTFDDWTVTIYSTSSYLLRRAFENWSNKMLMNFANVEDDGISDETNYMADASVQQLNRKDVEIQRYQLKSIWPMVVGDISLAYDANNQVEEFPVTFAVQWWESNSTDHGGSANQTGN